MLKIENFLGRFKEIEDKNKEKKIYIQKIIKEIINIEVNIKNINVKKDIIYIESSSLVKSKIILEKVKILEKINFEYKNIFKIK